MDEAVRRCTLAFADASAWRRAWETELKLGTCFVPLAESLREHTPIEVHFSVTGVADVLIGARVAFPDVDDAGNAGLRLNVNSADLPALRELYLKAQPAEEHPRDPTFIRTRVEVPLVPDDHLEPGSLVENRFEIERHLASGGMGDVYRANHVFLKRPIALKLLKRSLASDPAMWARFQREAELVCQLDSPHVVKVFDFGKLADGRPFLAMEFVEGTPLDLLLADQKRLEPARAVALLLQVCDGLGEVHALGIVHRDLKPPNIMVGRRRDGAELAKILDFGIARNAVVEPAKGVTGTGMVLGTPSYLAPEQALADSLDARTDIYALGCVAYEVLTGRPPFESDSFQKLVAMHLHQAPARPEAAWPALGAVPGLCDVVMRTLEKRREDRFQDVKSLATALQGAFETPRPETLDLPAEWAEPAAAPTPPPSATPAPAPAPPAEIPLAQAGLGAHAAFMSPELWEDSGPSQAQSELLAELKGQGIEIPEAAAEGLAARKADAAGKGPTASAFAELFGAAPDSPVRRRLLSEILVEANRYGAGLEALDEDGLSLVFPADSVEAAAGQAALFAVAAREWVRDEALCGSPEVSLRVGVAVGNARILAGRVPAGELWVEADLARAVEDLFELRKGADGAGVAIVERKAIPIGSPRVLGRDEQLALVEKRFDDLAEGKARPLLLTGPPGAGRSSLATELDLRARHREVFLCTARMRAGMPEHPYAAFAELICDALAVAPEELEAALPAALARMAVPPTTGEAVKVIAGVVQPPQPFSPGQAVHALRSVLWAIAGSRRVVMCFDGLEGLERYSLDGFGELCARHHPRDAVLGICERGFAGAQFPKLQALELPAFTHEQSARWVAQMLLARSVPKDVSDLVHRKGRGLPGLMQDWLFLLAGRGHLRRHGQTWALASEPPDLTDAALAAERVALMEPDVRRLFGAICNGGDLLSSNELLDALPYPSARAPQKLVHARLVRGIGRRRVAPAADRYAETLAGWPEAERRSLHREVAQAFVANGSVASARIGRHLLEAGDGEGALAAFRKAAQRAVQARLPRALARALIGGADAAALQPMGTTREGLRMRADALARAVSNALWVTDVAWARALVDRANALAGDAPSPEVLLANARVLRSEGRRAKAGEALHRAQTEAASSAALGLCLAERGDARESEGALDAAQRVFEEAAAAAEAARDLASWHGEVAFLPRMQTRLAGVRLQRKDIDGAVALFGTALAGWRRTGSAFAESRVLANLGTALALKKDFEGAQNAFAEAALAAARGGDLLFQARQLIQLAKVLKRAGKAAELTPILREAKLVAARVFWDEGQAQADQL